MDKTELKDHAEILREIKNTLDIVQFDSDELQELCDNLGDADFNIELDGAEYRFIHNSEIENVFADSIQEMVESCYDLSATPDFIISNLDWDGIVRDCMVDGYGHHFSSYDGSEHEVTNYYIFRTN